MHARDLKRAWTERRVSHSRRTHISQLFTGQKFVSVRRQFTVYFKIAGITDSAAHCCRSLHTAVVLSLFLIPQL